MQEDYHLYHNDSETSHSHALVVMQGKDPLGPYFIPDQTIFHPEEAGQPEDRGVVTFCSFYFPITRLMMTADRQIKHYTASSLPAQIEGKEVLLTLDLVRRRQLMRRHTAGHLIKSLLERHFPTLNVQQERYFPDQTTLLFSSATSTPCDASRDLQELATFLQREVDAITAKPRPILTAYRAKARTVQIEGLQPHTCQGLHLTTTAPLRSTLIREVRMNHRSEITIDYST